MASKDWDQTSLPRLFHFRQNAGDSHSQMFNIDISVWEPFLVVETGRALAGEDAEPMKSDSHKNHPP